MIRGCDKFATGVANMMRATLYDKKRIQRMILKQILMAVEYAEKNPSFKDELKNLLAHD